MADGTQQQGNPFIDQLLRELKLENLPEPKRTEVLTKIGELAEKRVLQTIIANMDEVSLTEFEQKLQTGMTEEQAAQFMMEKIPALAPKVEEALADLRDRIVADMGEIDAALTASQPTESNQPPTTNIPLSYTPTTTSPPPPLATPTPGSQPPSSPQPPELPI